MRGTQAAVSLGLAILALLLATACGAPPAPEPPAARPGPLTTRTRAHWSGDSLPWRSAAVDLLIDPANPLGLSAEETDRVGDHFRAYIDGEDHLGFRLGQLYGLLRPRWPARDEGHQPALAPEEQFLADAAEARRTLQRQADGQRREPAPYPDFHQGQTPPPGGVIPPLDLATPAWEAAIPPERQLTVSQVGEAVRRAAPGLDAETSARVLAELREAERQVRRMRDAWLGVTVILGRGDRPQRVVDRAATTARGDWAAVSVRLGTWAANQANERAAARAASPSPGPPR